MKTLAIVFALACGVLQADEFVFTKKFKRTDALIQNRHFTFRGWKTGRYLYERPKPQTDLPASGGAVGGFGAFGLGQLAPPSKDGEFAADIIQEVVFDGEDDWLTVVMKNGDVVRGQAESMNKTTLRLKGIDKAVRMSAVREIVATEPPREEAAE